MPDDFPVSSSPLPEAPLQTPPPPSREKGLLWIFSGETGLRAGWKVLLFLLVVQAILFVTRPLRHRFPKMDPTAMTASTTIIHDLTAFIVVILATLLMLRFIDHAPWGKYGLPLRRAFRSTFWVGAILGFGAVGLQLLIMRAGGWFYFGPLQLHGSAIIRMGLLWGLAFLLVGLFEEFLLRGYLFRTIADGIGFWPAAALTAALFAALHIPNKGETPFGIIMVFLDGVLMCFTLWKTGDLWFAAGQHAAWDWAQTFFFGVADSGTLPVGALHNPSFQGPPLLTGATTGPEGSIIVLIPLALTALLVAVLYKRRQPQPREETIPSAA